MLAADPHLGNKIPSFWQLMEVSWQEDGETFSSQGASTPGAPFIFVGRSKKMVWSMTAPVNDNSDLWQEELNADET